MDFNGIPCNSIEWVYYEDTTYTCRIFDCTNTDGNFSGNDCLDIYSINPILSVYGKTYGCAENCNICGDGFEVTKPSQVIFTKLLSDTQETFDVFNCSALSDLGMSGYLTTSECADMQDIVFEPCGCTAEAGTIPPPKSKGTKSPKERKM